MYNFHSVFRPLLSPAFIWSRNFAPLVSLYRQVGIASGHSPEKLKVGSHSLGYVSNSTEEAIEDYYPGYAETFTRIRKERGWPLHIQNKAGNEVEHVEFLAEAGKDSREDFVKSLIRNIGNEGSVIVYNKSFESK